MGTINSIRLININYNNGSIRINDEFFHLNGKSTLLSLQNGGGKSVLVQMLTAPFVHKNYRRTKDRPFENYFTGTKPSFILIEWLLDGGDRKLLNGFMIRKNPDETGEDDAHDELEITSIISIYDGECEWDIRHLPVVEKSSKDIKLKNYVACKQLFDSYKKSKEANFFYYDMNHGVQQRQYFDKLCEYKIDYREWENIIKKVNLKEGGLVDLFADCRDEKGLTEKWFLEAIEKKLDNEGSRIKEFNKITSSHIRQCYENEDKIKRKEAITLFKQLVARDDETDTLSVKKVAKKASLQQDVVEKQRDYIISFCKKIGILQEEAKNNIDDYNNKRKDKLSEIGKIVYEKYSAKIHAILTDKEDTLSNLHMTEMELSGIDRDIEEIQRKLHEIEAKRLLEVRESEKSFKDTLSAKLEVAKRKNEDLEPRRELLGTVIYGKYADTCAETKASSINIQAKIDEITSRLMERTALLEETENMVSKVSHELGILEGSISNFSSVEDEFNKRFNTVFRRNILGYYEDGMLTVEKADVSKKFVEADNECKNLKKKMEKIEILDRKYESLVSDDKVEKRRLLSELEVCKKCVENFESQLKSRRDIMSYLQLSEDMIYDKDKIIEKFDLKIRDMSTNIRQMEENDYRLIRELRALEEGIITELPLTIKEVFDKNLIPVIFGMYFLKKNGKSEKENLELVRKNPFLPYSLILTREELERLKNVDEEIVTSMPVPIVLRQELENGIIEPLNRNSSVVELDNISFFIHFNEKLLNEDSLAEMISLKKEEIKVLEDKLKIRLEEKEEYIKKREIIRGQDVTKIKKEEALAQLKDYEDNLLKLDEKITENETLRIRNKEEIKENAEKIRIIEDKRRVLSDQNLEMDKFIALYDAYVQKIEKKTRKIEERKRLESRKDVTKKAADKDRDLILQNTSLKEQLLSKLYNENKKKDLFEVYKDRKIDVSESDGEIKETFGKSLEELEAEYMAITKGVSADISSLETELIEQEKRLNRAKRNFENTIAKYGLSEECFDEIDASQENENKCLKMLSVCKNERDIKQKRFHEEDKKVSVLEAKAQAMFSQMKKETGFEDVLPKEQIIEQNFDEKIEVLRYEIKEIDKKVEGIIASLQSFKAVMASLAEYEELEPSSIITFEEDFKSMSEDELRKYRGRLVSSYMKAQEEQQRCRNRLSDCINDVFLNPVFADPYYKKPLEAMLRLLDEPKEILRQIEISVNAYDSLMKKIAVDLDMIEKEKESILSEILDYIRQVHLEMGKIDSNSTISVRERNIKMLTISLPAWQDNEEIYKVKVRDFIEEITKHCMGLFKRNESIAEYIGTKVNTKAMYDEIIGTSNVRIKLYKIEKQKEYAISWGEVAKNSGGEGFLSTFVILSSLLHYIRRDESDLFADRNEGKVLLMDNPFGMTYSEHLLKPMMDLAKKNHTQLICLSGLGGDSIYGRFDNIYVLNLVMASLKNGMQYLQAKHQRGSEIEEIRTSHIEVFEQGTLF